jgi:hypothetical protein
MLGQDSTNIESQIEELATKISQCLAEESCNNVAIQFIGSINGLWAASQAFGHDNAWVFGIISEVTAIANKSDLEEMLSDKSSSFCNILKKSEPSIKNETRLKGLKAFWERLNLVLIPDNQLKEAEMKSNPDPITTTTLQTPNTAASIVFKEDRRDALQDGNDCGFIALDIKRKEVMDFILENIQGELGEQIIKLLLPEIRMLCAIEYTNKLLEDDETEGRKKRLEELLEVAEALTGTNELNSVGEAINKLLTQEGKKRFVLTEEMSQTAKIMELFSNFEATHRDAQSLINACNDKLDHPEDQRKNIDELTEYFKHNLDDNEAKNLWKAARLLIEEAQNSLDQVLATEDCVRNYVQNYYVESKGWMAFQPNQSGGSNSSIVDVIAMMKKCEVITWQNTKGTTQLKPLYVTGDYSQDQQTVQLHIKYDGNIAGHFTALAMQEPVVICNISSVAQIVLLPAEISTQQLSKDSAGHNHRSITDEENRQRDLASLLNMYETIVKFKENKLTLIEAISCISKKAGGLGGLSFNDRNDETIRNKYGYRQRHKGNTINTSGPGIIYFEYLYRIHIIVKNLSLGQIPAALISGFEEDLIILQKKILYILDQEPNQLKRDIEEFSSLVKGDDNNLKTIYKFVDDNYKTVAANMVVDAAACLNSINLEDLHHKYFVARKLVIIGELLHELETDYKINLQQTSTASSKSGKAPAKKKEESGPKQFLALCGHANSIRNNLVHWHMRFLRILENPEVLKKAQEGILALAKISVEDITRQSKSEEFSKVVVGALELKKALENPLREEVESEIFHILNTANKIREIFLSQAYRDIREFYNSNSSELQEAEKIFKEFENEDIKELIIKIEGLEVVNDATRNLKHLVRELKKFVRQQDLGLIQERYNNLMEHEEYISLLELAKGEIEDFDIQNLDQISQICKNLANIKEGLFVEQSKKLKKCLTDLMGAHKEENCIRKCEKYASLLKKGTSNKDFTEINFHDTEQVKQIQPNVTELERNLRELVKIQGEPVNIKSLADLSKEYSREVEKIKKLLPKDQEALKIYKETVLALENLEKLNQERQGVMSKRGGNNRLTTLVRLINQEMEYLSTIEHDSTILPEHKQAIMEHIITVVGQYVRDLENSDKGKELKILATKTFDTASYNSKVARSNGLAHDIFSLNENLLSDRVQYDVLPARHDYKAIFTIRKSGPVATNMTAMVLHSLGNAFYRLGFYKEAIDCFKKALSDIRDNSKIEGTPNFRTKLDQYKLDTIGITQPTAICIDMTYNLFGIDGYELDILSELSTIASDSDDKVVMTDIIKFITETIDKERVKKYKDALIKIEGSNDVLLQLLAELDPETLKVYSEITETINSTAAPFVIYYPEDKQTLDRISSTFSSIGHAMVRDGIFDVAGGLFATSIELSGSKQCHETAVINFAECARRIGNVDMARELYNQAWEDPVSEFMAKIKLAEISCDEEKDIKSELIELDSFLKKHKNTFDDRYGDRTLDYQLHLYGLKLKNCARPLSSDLESLESQFREAEAQFQEAEALIKSNKLRFQDVALVKGFYLIASLVFASVSSGAQREESRRLLNKSEYCYKKGCANTSLSYQAADMLANGYNYYAEDFPLKSTEKSECVEKFNYYRLQSQPSGVSPLHNTTELRGVSRHSSTSLSSSTNLTTATDPSIITSDMSAVIRTSNADTVRQEDMKKAIKEAYRRSWKRGEPKGGWNFEVTIIGTDKENLRKLVVGMLNCHEKDVDIIASGGNKYWVDLTSDAVKIMNALCRQLSL